MKIYITEDEWEKIPEAYKEEHSLTQPDRRSCFICFLTKAYFCAGTTLCFEHTHFEVMDPAERRTFSEIQRRNGDHAVHCLQDEEAVRFYDSGSVEVWEYAGDTGDRLERWTLYAYQWRDEYADDLTESELEERLSEMAKYASLTSCKEVEEVMR